MKAPILFSFIFVLLASCDETSIEVVEEDNLQTDSSDADRSDEVQDIRDPCDLIVTLGSSVTGSTLARGARRVPIAEFVFTNNTSEELVAEIADFNVLGLYSGSLFERAYIHENGLESRVSLIDEFPIDFEIIVPPAISSSLLVTADISADATAGETGGLVLKSILLCIKNNDWKNLDVVRLKNKKDIYRVRKGKMRIIILKSDSSVSILSVERRSDTTYNV